MRICTVVFGTVFFHVLGIIPICRSKRHIRRVPRAKWNAASRLGASLDSAADFILIAALLYALIPRFDWPNWVVFWIAAVALIRFCSLIACRIRFHSFAFYTPTPIKRRAFCCSVSPF
jgi:CDP-diacylglycerol--glycerol-3-phosphate 3-phosphatidyltransferase